MSALTFRPDFISRNTESRNFWVYLFDCGMCMLGMAFIDMGLVVPQISQILLDHGQSQTFVNSIPLFTVLTLFGSMVTATLAERLQFQKKFVVGMLWAQRLPFLFAGLVLFFLGPTYPVPCFWFAMAMMAIFFLVSGLVVNSWNELFLKTFRIENRSGIISKRNLFGLILTICLGCYLVKQIMPASGADAAMAAQRFGVLFLVCFAFTLLSLIFVSLAEEPATPQRSRPRTGTFTYLRKIPEILRNDLYFSKYYLIAILSVAWIPVMPNYSLYVTRTLDKGPDYAGTLLGVMGVGSMVGNIIAGRMGDARGGRYCLLWGRGLIAGVLFGLLLLPPSAIGFTLLTGLLATAIQICGVGDYCYVTEMAPEDERPTYLSIYRLLLVPVTLAGVGIGILWANLHLATELVMAFGGLSMLACLAMTFLLPEPREQKALIDRSRRDRASARMSAVVKPMFPMLGGGRKAS